VTDPLVPGGRWVSPARRDAARVAEIGVTALAVDGVAAIPPSTLSPPAGAGPAAPSIRITDDVVELHLVTEYGDPVRTVAERLAAAVAPLLGGRELRLVIDDILLPGEVLTDHARRTATGEPPR